MTTADREAFDKANRSRRANGHDDAGQEPPALPQYVPLGQLKLSRDVFWLIEDTLPRGTMVMVYGPGGCGKTYLGSSVAMGITSGQWYGRAAEPGAVLYCAFERPDDAEDRLAALRDRLQLGTLPIGLLRLPGIRLDDAIADHVIGQSKALAATANVPIRGVIIDTVSAALAGAKEDDEGLGQLRAAGERIAVETGATVFWLHHEGKADRNGPRGHLVLAEACMVWWRLEEREDSSRVVHVDKANRGPTQVPLFAFRLEPFTAGQDQRGRDIQLCELQLVDLDGALASKPRQRFGAPATTKVGHGPVQKILLGELAKLARRHPDGVDEATLKSVFVASFHAQRVAEGKPALEPKRYTGKFNDTLGPLIESGIVARHGDGSLLPGIGT